CALRRSADPVEEVRRGVQVEATRKDHDRLQARRALGPLEQADLRPVQVAALGERLLREAGPVALTPEVCGELLAGGRHRSDSGSAQTKAPQTVVIRSCPQAGAELETRAYRVAKLGRPVPPDARPGAAGCAPCASWGAGVLVVGRRDRLDRQPQAGDLARQVQ